MLFHFTVAVEIACYHLHLIVSAIFEPFPIIAAVYCQNLIDFLDYASNISYKHHSREFGTIHHNYRVLRFEFTRSFVQNTEKGRNVRKNVEYIYIYIYIIVCTKVRNFRVRTFSLLLEE